MESLERISIPIYANVGDNIGKVEYIQHVGDEVTIVNAARVSFGKEREELSDADIKLIKYLIKHRHTSTLEHNTITYRFTVPLFIRSQHMRHRTWSYNEISRRYTDIDMQFYEPNLFRTQHKSNRQASNPEDLINPIVTYVKTPHGASSTADNLVKLHNERSLHLFNALISSGVCREQARGVLPQNLYTQYYGTVNLNNLLKFIELRSHVGAQWEIQQVALACKEIASQIWPNVFSITKKTESEIA
tara:strand:- start:1044 stop:1781 length:738 start_codon:yes stop_codon:yes gene_type:complete